MHRIPLAYRILTILSVSTYKMMFKNAGVLPLNLIPTWNPIKTMSLSYEFYSTYNPAILYSPREIHTHLFKWVPVGYAALFLYRKAV